MQNLELEIRKIDEQIQTVKNWAKTQTRGLKHYKKSLEKSLKLLQEVSENAFPEILAE